MKTWKKSIALSALFLSVSAHAELIDKRTPKAEQKPLAVHPSDAQTGAVPADSLPVNKDTAEAPQPLTVSAPEVAKEAQTPAPAPVAESKAEVAPVAEAKPDPAPEKAAESVAKATNKEPTKETAKAETAAPVAEATTKTASLATTSSVIPGVVNLYEVPTHIKVNTAYLMEPVVGFGNQVPVAVALRQIVPAMQLVGQSPVDKTTVSWDSKGTRMDALKSMFSSNQDFALVVDGSNNVVTMMGKTAAEEYAKTDLNRVWRVLVGDARVDRSIERWAREAGYSFRWDAERHFLVSASSEFHGTIESAVNELLSTTGIRDSDYPLEACIYSNSPPLLRVTRLGDQSNQCR